MNEIYKKFYTKAIWVTIIFFCIRCFLSGIKIISAFSIYDIYGYAGEAIALSALVMLGYEKQLWKYNPLEETPVLKKKYTGTVVSNYDKIEREATLEIKQTLLSINVIMTTDQSRSKTVSSSIQMIQGEWQLLYCYLNVPKAAVRERSAMHYGTALLYIDDVEQVHGQYFTDRQTTGDLYFITE